jgi:hypothetical protein
MAKNQRVVDMAFLNSGPDIESIEYNPASGAQKALLVGPRLLPIPLSGTTWTTDASTRRALPILGANIAVYNNAGAVASIVIGGSTITTLAPGATDASGNVGVALPPNAWTYLSMSNNQYVITSAATALVYIVEDPTRIIQETGPYAQQNNGNTQPIS